MIAALLLLVGALPLEPLTLETTTTAFTPVWELALDDGRAFRRRAGAKGAWELLPPAGVPVPSARIELIKELVVPLLRSFEPATRLEEISADGDNIIVVDDRRRVYYAKLGTLADRVGAWTDVWGPPGLAAPLTLPAQTIGWAISHRAQAYEDIDGNTHPVSAGVTTLYALMPSTDDHGSRIGYQDPWLPPPGVLGARWEREVCPPERGSLTLVSLAASASTIAVMDDGGRVHTRLADFDTMGHNPALPYSWHREKRTGLSENVRSLPPEEWRVHARVPGPHTTALTVFFTGEGNAKRRLRVEGSQNGRRGFWEKDLLDPAWRFVAVPRAQPSGAPVVAPRAPTLRKPRGEDLRGKTGKATVEVSGFDLQCPGARVTVKRDAEEVSLVLWHTDRLLEVDRREHDLRGALILEGDPRGKLADDVRTLFGSGGETASVYEVEVDVRERFVEVKSATAQLTADPSKLGKRKLKVRLARPR